MRFLLLALLLVPASPALAAKQEKLCSCKCVTKSEDDENKYVNTHGKGKDREAAGIDLKKNLGKKKCELTPVCEGAC
jgi:hypothetical protein